MSVVLVVVLQWLHWSPVTKWFQERELPCRTAVVKDGLGVSNTVSVRPTSLKLVLVGLDRDTTMKGSTQGVQGCGVVEREKGGGV